MEDNYRISLVDDEFERLIQELEEAESMYNHAEGHFKDIAYRRLKVAQENIDIEIKRRKLEEAGSDGNSKRYLVVTKTKKK